jgi:hypothetical protein
MIDRETYDQDLKQRILDHCAWIATFDRDYAILAFRNYCTDLDWLGLRDKRTQTPESRLQVQTANPKGGGNG